MSYFQGEGFSGWTLQGWVDLSCWNSNMSRCAVVSKISGANHILIRKIWRPGSEDHVSWQFWGSSKSVPDRWFAELEASYQEGL